LLHDGCCALRGASEPWRRVVWLLGSSGGGGGGGGGRGGEAAAPSPACWWVMRSADRFLAHDFLADVDLGMQAPGDAPDAGIDGNAVAAVKVDAAHPLGARRMRLKRCSPALLSSTSPQFHFSNGTVVLVASGVALLS